MSRLWAILAAAHLASLTATGRAGPLASRPGVDDAPARPPALAMTPGVVCSKVDGLDQVTPVPDAALTNLDKLKVYFRPLHYKVETDPKRPHPHRVRFTEDGRVRRKGEKTPLAKEDKLLEYEDRFDSLDKQFYLVNVVGLDKFPPGDYEFDITLHDEIDGSAVARQTVPFRVVPIKGGQPSDEAKPAPAPTAKKAKPGRPSKRPG